MKPGDELPPFTVESVDPARMKTMAVLLRDPNPIHFDVDVVRRLGLGDRQVNQGPIHFAYIVNMLTEWAQPSGRLEEIDVRFLGNVFAGDRVVAGGSVTDVDRDHGTVRCEVWLQVVDGPRAIEGEAVVRFSELEGE